jgi:hypothetical protein
MVKKGRITSSKNSLKERKTFSKFHSLIFITVFAAIGLFAVIKSFAATPTTYYVSKNGSNTGGTSWATAFNELNQINWTLINPGDTILIDGGTTACPSNYDFASHTTDRPGLNCGMLYSTDLNVQKSGTSTLPVTIKLASEAGHAGTAVIFGGRPNMLPYCTQTSYTAGGTARSNGVTIGAFNNIVIDGTHRSGIMVYGAQHGVNFASNSTSSVTIRNFEIFDNGTFSTGAPGNGGYRTDQKGVSLDGSNITIDRTLIHDNGQDEIQDEDIGGTARAHNPLHDITISSSWIYGRRDHPLWTGYGFSSGGESGAGGVAGYDCTHVDGVQIFGGGPHQLNFTVKDSIFGPLLGQALYPGDQGVSTFDNVTVTNSLFIDSFLHNLAGDYMASPSDSSTPLNWKIQNVTSYYSSGGVRAGTPSHGNGVWGGGHGITNSIFQNGYFAYTPAFTGTNSANIYFGGDPVPGATNTNPNFVGPLPATNSPGYAALAAADFTPQCTSCAGKGSSIHKPTDLLSMIDSLNGTSGGGGITPGDVNSDGHVNSIDLSVLLSKWDTADVNGDINRDGIVDALDLSILLSHYGL